MSGEFAKDFAAYYSPALNRSPLKHEINVELSMQLRESNPFGANHSSCEYHGVLQDYQNVTRYCEASPARSIANVPVSSQSQREPASCSLRSEAPCIDTLSARSGTAGFGTCDMLNPIKRSRTTFEPHQLRRLQYEFKREMYMVGMKRRNLSKELDLSEKQIKIWFQNRRMKEKREHTRKQHRALGNIQNGCVARGMVYSDEFGGQKVLERSNSCNTNNPQMVMF